MLNAPQGGRLLVQRVVGLSPADFAGIRGGSVPVVMGGEKVTLGGDVILEVAGVKFTSSQNLSKLMEVFQSGEKLQKPISITFLREGKLWRPQ